MVRTTSIRIHMGSQLVAAALAEVIVQIPAAQIVEAEPEVFLVLWSA